MARLLRGRLATSVTDLRDVTDDPLAAGALAGFRPFLIQVPLAHCRNRVGFPYAENGPHPLVRTARAYIEGRISSYEGSPLQRFHDHLPTKKRCRAIGVAW